MFYLSMATLLKKLDMTLAASFVLSREQCAQMTKYSFQYWQLATMKICPLS